jgi:hypothetical protein
VVAEFVTHLHGDGFGDGLGFRLGLGAASNVQLNVAGRGKDGGQGAFFSGLNRADALIDVGFAEAGNA